MARIHGRNFLSHVVHEFRSHSYHFGMTFEDRDEGGKGERSRQHDKKAGS